MKTPATTADYADRAIALDHAALDERMRHDCQKFAEFNAQATGIENHFVKAGKLGREIGISFQGYYLPPKAESAEVWYNEHYRKNLGMDYDRFKWFIAISRKLPENPRTMQDVLPAIQQTLFAGELIIPPERSEEQISHETPPAAFFFKSLRGLQANLEKRLTEAPHWDQQTRSSIRAEIIRTEAWLESVKLKI